MQQLGVVDHMISQCVATAQCDTDPKPLTRTGKLRSLVL